MIHHRVSWRAWLKLALLSGPAMWFTQCGPARDAELTPLVGRFAISKTACPTSALQDLQARVYIRTLEGVDVREPCPLQVVVVGTDLEVRGSCAGVKGREDKKLLLQWYVPFAQKEIVIAESELTIALSSAKVSEVKVQIDAADIFIRSKTTAQESEADRNRFNCDRTGISYCVDTQGTPSGPDNDTCSNLEELCAGTLFTTNVATCP
jgi:hypothetical protein